MTTPDLTWDDDDLIAAGYEPGFWDRHGNPVPAPTTIDDWEAIEADMVTFNNAATIARTAGLITDDDIRRLDVRRRAGLAP